MMTAYANRALVLPPNHPFWRLSKDEQLRLVPSWWAQPVVADKLSLSPMKPRAITRKPGR